MSDNTITLVGNLTRDPELRFTTTGRGVARLASLSVVVIKLMANGRNKLPTSTSLHGVNLAKMQPLHSRRARELLSLVVSSNASTPLAKVTSAPPST